MAAQLLGRADGNTNYSTQYFIVTNGVTVNKGDFVYFASGRITNSSIGGQKLLGMALETAVGTSGSVKCAVCVDPTMRYLIDNDNDTTTFGATHPGTYFDLIGATGAQLVDTSSTSTTGQLLCLEYNPQVDPVRTDTSWGTFVIAEHYFYPAQ
jgi:hypothetical protein